MSFRNVEDWIQAGQRGGDPAQLGITINEIANSLDLGSLTWQDFVADIVRNTGPEQDLIIIGQVFELLHEILLTVAEQPTRHEIHFLSEYLLSRVDNADFDAHFRAGMVYIARSLTALCLMPRFYHAEAARLVTGILRFGATSSFSSQLASTREAIYLFINAIFGKHGDRLVQDISVHEIISGVVAMAELEKNPSCLRALFKIYYLVSTKWPLDDNDFKLVFDSVIRYFPISMKAAPSQPDVPTTEELRELLLQSLVAHDGYADATFAAMKDRLDVDSANTKLEALKTIEKGVKSYSMVKVSQSAHNLWDSLKFEVWNGENEDFIEPALRIFRGIGSTLSHAVSIEGEFAPPLLDYVSTVSTECNQRIRDGKKTYVVASGRILEAVASSSPASFTLITRSVLPAIDVLWQGSNDGSERKLVVGVLNNILGARLQQADMLRMSELSANELEALLSEVSKMAIDFDAFRRLIVEIYNTELMKICNDPFEEVLETGVPTVRGLALLFKIPAYLTIGEKSVFMDELTVIFLGDKLGSEAQEEMVSALKQIISLEPDLYRAKFLPANMARLPQTIPSPRNVKNSILKDTSVQLEKLVEVSCSLPSQHELGSGDPAQATTPYTHRNFEAMENQLLGTLKGALQHRDQTEYATTLLATMQQSLKRFDEAINVKSPDVITIQGTGSTEGPYTEMVLDLFSMVVQPKLHDDVNGYTGIADLRDNISDQCIDIIGNIAMIVLRSSSTTPENNFLLNWNAKYSDEPSAIWSLFSKNPAQDTLNISQPNLIGGPSDKCLANVLSMYLVAGSRVQAKQHLKIDIGKTAAAMINNATSTSLSASQLARQSVLWMLQLLVNKYGAARVKLSVEGETIVQLMEGIVKNAPEDDQAVRNIYQTLAYFAAASLASMDKSVEPLVKLMLKGVSHPGHGRKVAQTFRLLLAPSNIMSKQNFCNIRVLRKGRLFELTVQDLLSLFRTSEVVETKTNAIIAMVGIFAFLEADIIRSNAKSILPVVLEGTNIQNDDWSKAACIETLLRLIPLVPHIVEEHLGSVINRMTDRTHNTLTSPSDSSIRCRAMALEVLQALTVAVPARQLLRRKPALMKELDVALDDCSREVRRKAEQCKMAWFNLADTE